VQSSAELLSAIQTNARGVVQEEILIEIQSRAQNPALIGAIVDCGLLQAVLEMLHDEHKISKSPRTIVRSSLQQLVMCRDVF
jgi:hypothetical protein